MKEILIKLLASAVISIAPALIIFFLIKVEEIKKSKRFLICYLSSLISGFSLNMLSKDGTNVVFYILVQLLITFIVMKLYKLSLKNKSENKNIFTKTQIITATVTISMISAVILFFTITSTFSSVDSIQFTTTHETVKEDIKKLQKVINVDYFNTLKHELVEKYPKLNNKNINRLNFQFSTIRHNSKIRLYAKFSFTIKKFFSKLNNNDAHRVVMYSIFRTKKLLKANKLKFVE